MNNSREIRRRIKSIKNTAKITHAMEMVSAAKMRKAVSGVVAIRPYAHSAWSVLLNLSRAFKRYESGLLEVREVKSILIVLVTSNRGLCGSFNAQVFRKVRSELSDPEKMRINRVGEEKIKPKISGEKLNVEFLTIGKKGENFVRKLGYNIIATFPNLTYFSPSEETRPAARLIMDSYLEKKYDKIAIIYTDYISAVNQKTRIRQILPISEVDLEKQIVEMDIMAKEYGVKIPELEYKVEPSPEEVLDYIFPRLIEMQIYHAILESVASKESARMVAMKNATEAGQDMADMLTLAFNQIRQAKITQEISEISAGRVALEE